MYKRDGNAHPLFHTLAECFYLIMFPARQANHI